MVTDADCKRADCIMWRPSFSQIWTGSVSWSLLGDLVSAVPGQVRFPLQVTFLVLTLPLTAARYLNRFSFWNEKSDIPYQMIRASV